MQNRLAFIQAALYCMDKAGETLEGMALSGLTELIDDLAEAAMNGGKDEKATL